MSFARPTRGARESGPMLGFAIWTIFFVWLLIFSPLVTSLAGLIPGSDSLLWTFLLTALRFLPLWLMAWFTPRLLGRAPRTLIRPAGTFDFWWLAVGFGSWFALSASLAALEWLADPESYTLTFSWGNAALSLLVALLVFPVQTSAEELVFRGLIPQALGQVVRADWLLALLSGLLFALPHLLNPEAVGQPGFALIAYGALGATWSYAVLRTGGLEVALGAHLANNIFALSVVGYENSALPAIAVWTTPAIALDQEALKSVVGGLVWLYAVHWLRGRRER